MSSNKTYLVMFPQKFQQLVSMLHHQRPELLHKVGKLFWEDPLEAIKIMNKELDVLTLPEQTVEECCDVWMDALHKQRKVIEIFSSIPHEHKQQN